LTWVGVFGDGYYKTRNKHHVIVSLPENALI